MRAFILVVALLCRFSSAPLAAQEQRIDNPGVTIIGHTSALVTTATVRLGDLADIQARRLRDDEIVIGLQRITIIVAPRPGEETTVSAAAILERLRASGVNLREVGYRLPRIIKVKRAGRSLGAAELEHVIGEFLRGGGEDVRVKSVRLPEAVIVAPGEISFKVRQQAARQPGRRGFAVTVAVPNEPEVHFTLQAEVEEWFEVPVAARPIVRGELIEEEDVRLARLNAAALPRDAAHQRGQVVGHRADVNVGFGEIFRQGKLEIPPIVDAGANVVMTYRSKGLEATATGVALDSGQRGQEVRVRNSASRKVIAGIVLEPGLVGVRP